jgi:hypothetical protein
MCIRHCRDWGNPADAAFLREYFDATGDHEALIEALRTSGERGDGAIEYFFLDQMSGLPDEVEKMVKALGYDQYMNSSAETAQ